MHHGSHICKDMFKTWNAAQVLDCDANPANEERGDSCLSLTMLPS